MTALDCFPNRMVREVQRLAATAQDNVLNSIACHVLARMAYIAPDLVLPLMHERFEVRTADAVRS